MVAVCALLGALATPGASLGAPASPATAAPAAPQPAPPAAAAAPKAAGPPAPVSIPVPQIVAQAAEVRNLLRDLETLTAPVPAIMAIQTPLLDVSAELRPESNPTTELLEHAPP